MTATNDLTVDPVGVAAIIVALAFLVLAVAGWLLIWRRGFKQMEVRLGAASATLEAVEKSVNHVGDGPTLIELTQGLAKFADRTDLRIASLESWAMAVDMKLDQLDDSMARMDASVAGHLSESAVVWGRVALLEHRLAHRLAD